MFFDTTRAHVEIAGARAIDCVVEEAKDHTLRAPFKGNMDIEKLRGLIEKHGADKIAYVRIETGTNLIGGQPHSLENMQEIRKVCDEFGLMLVLDASLLADNLYFIKTREEKCKDMSIREITRAMADLSDIIYFSARKLGCARGGGICIRDKDLPLWAGVDQLGRSAPRATGDQQLTKSYLTAARATVDQLIARGALRPN